MMRGVPPLSGAEYHVLYTTGPGLVSRTLAENVGVANTVTVLFPDDVCDIESWNRFGHFGVHLMEGTWRASSSYLRRRIAQTIEFWTVQRRIREGRRRGATRRVPAQDPSVR
jgi:hypothetical protein